MMKKAILMLVLIPCILFIGCGKEESSETISPIVTEEESDEITVENDQTENPEGSMEIEDETIETTDKNLTASLDDYIGTYDDGADDQVIIAKDGDAYSMQVSIFRLTLIDEGTVSLESDKVIFDAIDAAGNPIKFSFYREGETYTLKVEETTWTYFEVGDQFPGMMKTE